MADTFVETLLKYLGDLIEPKSAEAKVIAGDKEAAQLLEEVRSRPLSPHSKVILDIAERLPETVTVFGSGEALLPESTKHNPTDRPYTASEMRPGAGGYFSPEKQLYIDTDRYRKYSETSRQYTFIHELGHFVHVQNRPLTEAPSILGLGFEEIANLLSVRNTLKDMGIKGKPKRDFEALWLSIFGFPLTQKYVDEQFKDMDSNRKKGRD